MKLPIVVDAFEMREVTLYADDGNPNRQGNQGLLAAIWKYVLLSISYFRKLLPVSLIVAAGIWLVSAPSHADQVSIRVGIHQDFGRLVFEWKRLVIFSAHIEKGQLIVEFDRPVESSLAALPGALRKYLRRPRLSNSGRRVVFPLVGEYDVRAFNLGRSIVVDLFDPEAPPAHVVELDTPPGLKPNLKSARKSDTPPALRQKFWQAQQKPGQAQQQPGQAQQQPGQAQQQPEQSQQKPEQSQQKPAIPQPSSLEAPSVTPGKGFAAKPSGPPASGQISQALPSAGPEPIGRVDTVAGTVAVTRVDGTRVNLAVGDPVFKGDVVETGSSGSLGLVFLDESTFSLAQNGSMTLDEMVYDPLSEKGRAAINLVEGVFAMISGQIAKTGPDAMVLNTPVATIGIRGTTIIGEQRASLEVGLVRDPDGSTGEAVVTTQAGSVVLPDEGAFTSVASALSPPARVEIRSVAELKQKFKAAYSIVPLPPPLGTGSTIIRTGLPPPAAATLRLDWEEPVAAAVFRRAGNLWLVFDKAKAFDAGALLESVGTKVRKLDQLPSERATILRLQTAEGINPTLSRDGFSWLFEFRRQSLSVQTAIPMQPQLSPSGTPRLFMPVTQVAAAIPFLDPEVGDNLIVVPVISLGHGMPTQRHNTQLTVLPSAQGVVVQPHIDQLRVMPTRTGIEISSTEQLALSARSARAKAYEQFASGFQSFSRVFPPDSWRRARRSSISKFNKINSDLLFETSLADPSNRKRARMNLALYNLGNRFASEALGILLTVAADEPKVLKEPQYRLLVGAVNFALRRYPEARENLFHSSLNGNDEGRFWRAAVRAAQGDPKGAAPVLKELAPIVHLYPRSLRVPLGILVANAAIATKDTRMGLSHLEALEQEELTPLEINQLSNVEGKLKRLTGDLDGAVTAFEAAEKGEHRRSAAEATMERTKLLLARKQISLREAIEELEKLRYAWRGDKFEFELLHRLGVHYLSINDYRSGLRTLQQAVTYFHEYSGVKEITQKMSNAFIRLFFHGAEHNLTHFDTIALYEEFNELIPSGSQGDAIVRKQAYRLATVDLLDAAARLLEKQVNSSLQGLQKAQVGARLAAIYLLNREPKRAEQSLLKSEIAQLPDDTALERRRLLARSIADQGRRNEGLEIINDDESYEADLLRVEIFWRARQWAKASIVLQRLFAHSGAKPREGLNNAQARTALNLSVALALSMNERGLTRLREEFGAAMNKTPLGDAFNLISSSNSSGPIDYRTLTGQVKEVTDFGSFLSAYKEKIASYAALKRN